MEAIIVADKYVFIAGALLLNGHRIIVLAVDENL
jgi:hypothetical protein